MYADRIKETTTTIGTGNITLAGAVTNFKTLSNDFALNQRFSYWINDTANNVWEHGIGYLSATVTLVREKVLRNSSGTLIALNLAAGTKYVYCADSAETTTPASKGSNNTISNCNYRFITSGHLTRNSITTHTHVGTRIVYMPFWLNYAGTFDGFACDVTTAAGTSANKIHLGLYDRDNTGMPKNKILSVIDLDPSTTGVKIGTFTEQSLATDWYYIAMWCDVNFVVLANVANYSLPPQVGLQNAGQQLDLQYIYVIAAGLADLPADAQAAGTIVTSHSSTPPRIMLRSAY